MHHDIITALAPGSHINTKIPLSKNPAETTAMGARFYAVKAGRETGIFHSWK